MPPQPTADGVRRALAGLARSALDSDPTLARDLVRSALHSQPDLARDLVIAARDVIEAHCSNAWVYRVDIGPGVTPYKTLCGCRDCDWLTPISRILLPEEMLYTPGQHPTT